MWKWQKTKRNEKKKKNRQKKFIVGIIINFVIVRIEMKGKNMKRKTFWALFFQFETVNSFNKEWINYYSMARINEKLNCVRLLMTPSLKCHFERVNKLLWNDDTHKICLTESSVREENMGKKNNILLTLCWFVSRTTNTWKWKWTNHKISEQNNRIYKQSRNEQFIVFWWICLCTLVQSTREWNKTIKTTK